MATSTASRPSILDVGADAARLRKDSVPTLHRAFVKTAHRHPLRFAMGDQRAPRVSYLSALTKTIFLARRLARIWQGQEMVGILLPPSVAGALVNFAALLLGRIPVNLNYTAPADVLASCLKQCGITTVVSSKAFLEKVPIQLPCPIHPLEDIAASPRTSEKLTALFASFLPVAMLEKFLGRPRPARPDDTATVIFSSGSTGDPKGVVLTHYNIGANVEQVRQVFQFEATDRFLGILPFFHSFGFMGTLMLTATSGIGAVYHPNPREAKAIGEIVRENKITFVIATPTFLQMYHRACQPEDFRTARVVLTGAEKLPDRLAAAFEEKFGVRPIEGYGCTECAPVVAANRPEVPGDPRGRGCKSGTVGRPMPGMSVKIVDPDTMQPVQIDEPGLLMVKGPNVMSGYLNKPQQTAEVLIDGWYVTGDIVALDADGFLRITDRLSRFSKIGGEMVPHVKIEEKLHELAGLTEQAMVVTGVADSRKGERLVVLHVLEEPAVRNLISRLNELDLPNLWIPRPNHFFRVPALPVLGSGKLDLRQIKNVATSLAGSETASVSAVPGSQS